MKELNSIEELEKLASGEEKDKLLAATYGYQPILDKLKSDENENVSNFAHTLDKDKDLKFYQNDQELDEKKSQFEQLLKRYKMLFLGSIITIAIAFITILIGTIMFFTSGGSTTGIIMTTIIFTIISVVLFLLSNKVEKKYQRSKYELSQTKYIYDISKDKVEMLQKEIESNY
ncbi:hypothetical protein [Staphylococcus caprae]|uniref:hypothetical protein n=1 Tax=Staphylococcus caprae TaxID=29380 RepID=UPI001451EC4B|nr:hypothetical protein [Staphylococcus caprae]QJE26689.1 hypothetical protein HHJ99_13035 [Staphylococcus caprae]